MTKNYNLSIPIETLKISLKSELKNSTDSIKKQPESANITVFVKWNKEENSNISSTSGSTTLLGEQFRMSASDLSREFTKNFQDIETYTKKLINYLGKPIDSSWIMSECYLYLHSNINQLDTPRTMISYAKNWIKNNLKWTNSPLNRQIRVNNLSTDSPTIPGTSGVFLFDSDEIIDQLQDFRENLSTYDKRLFNIYYDLDLRKGKEIAEHLDISISSAYPIIKECKKLEHKLRNHIKLNNPY
jgi:DNA-directed RNA polymerase specialized sigma subunit